MAAIWLSSMAVSLTEVRIRLGLLLFVAVDLASQRGDFGLDRGVVGHPIQWLISRLLLLMLYTISGAVCVAMLVLGVSKVGRFVLETKKVMGKRALMNVRAVKLQKCRSGPCPQRFLPRPCELLFMRKMTSTVFDQSNLGYFIRLALGVLGR